MARITPFRAYRPKKELAAKIAALPYDVYTTEEARVAAKNNPFSFLRVDKAEIELDESVGQYDDAVYRKAAENLNHMIEHGILEQDTRESLYIYRLENGARCQTGIAALTSIDEYVSGFIKKHELTREDKEADRVRHIESCGAHTGPIFLAYAANESIKSIADGWIEQNEPSVWFDDGVKNTVWQIDNPLVIDRLVCLFSDIESLYIADGHHRNAAAVKAGLKMRERNKNHTGNEWYNYCLSVMFPHDELCIMPYNRVINDLNGLSPELFLELLSENFVITNESKSVLPQKRREFGMLLDNSWYKLALKAEAPKQTAESLDVSLIQNFIIDPLLGIRDIRSDTRIDFTGGADSIAEIERRAAKGDAAVGFTMYATSIADLMAIADGGGIMPPKSTWFEPKLRSGLFIHK